MTYDGVNVLVTGADGFIGSHLTEALVSEGANVTALTLYNSFDSYGWLDEIPHATKGRLDLVRGDVRDAAFVSRIMPGKAVIFHLAALIAIPHSYAAAQTYVETNVLGTLNVLEAARQTGAERIVHTSTSEVYGTALRMPISEDHPLQGQSPYAASKIGADMMAEAFARSFGLPVVTLRPFNTYGPRQSERAIIPTILRQALDPSCDAVRVGDTTPLRDLTYVEDTVRAFLAAGLSGSLEFGRAYNAGSQKAVRIADLIEIVLDLAQCSKPVVQEDIRMRPAHSEVRALLADSSQFAATTGWAPRTGLRGGLSRTLDWWRSRLSAGRVRQQSGFMT